MTIMDNIAYMVRKIEEAIDHPTLNRCIQKPFIDNDYILILYAMFEENGSYSEVDDYITSISLVHLALETHDLIRLDASTTDKERKLRQLTVLAGDFYSSQYYQLLAKHADFSMIKFLSDAIQKINEYKTSFFNQDLPGQRLIDLIRHIESTLLVHVAKGLNLPKWKDFITDYFFVTRLLKEKQNYMNGRMTKFLGHIISDKPDLKKSYLQIIDEAIKEGSRKLLHLPQEEFPFIEHLTHQTLFRSEKPDVSLIAEEG